MSAPFVPSPSVRPDSVHSEMFLHALMRRQFALSAMCAAAFLVGLIGLPLANYFAPQLMATRIGGFTLTWFLLGILFFPYVWIVAWIFIRRSRALEIGEIALASRFSAIEQTPSRTSLSNSTPTSETDTAPRL